MAYFSPLLLYMNDIQIIALVKPNHHPKVVFSIKICSSFLREREKTQHKKQKVAQKVLQRAVGVSLNRN
jgi:hypothetical protein